MLDDKSASFPMKSQNCMPSGPNRDPKGNPFLKKTVEFGLAALPEGNADPPFYSPKVNRIRGFQKYTQVSPPKKKKGSSWNFVEISSRRTVRLDGQRPDSIPEAQPGSRVARKGEAGAGLGDGYNPRRGLKARPHPFHRNSC
jgi:hypothetical protein